MNDLILGTHPHAVPDSKFRRVLITGCGGMLGSALYPDFAARFPLVVASDLDVSEPWLAALDVTDATALCAAFDLIEPDLVLHLAAKTDLEFCEREAAVASAANHLATRMIAHLCAARDIDLVYISTAGVFDGTKAEPYCEDDAPNPLMIYGETKFQGEEAVRSICKRHYVVRAGWMIGGGRGKDKKFVAKIIEQLEQGAHVIHAVADRLGTPTYTRDFSQTLLQLIETGAYGTYHMVCEGSGSRLDVAQAIVDFLGADAQVKAVDSSFFSDRYFAPRPVSEIMVNARLDALGIRTMRPWREALREYLEQEFGSASTRAAQ